MTHEHQAHDSEFLEPPLEAAVQAVLSEPIPDAAVERVRQRARRLALDATVTLRPTQDETRPRRRWTQVVITTIVVAALLLVATTMMLDRSTGRAFAQVIEKVKAASSVRFTTAMRLGLQPEVTGLMYLEGNRLRHEQFDGQLVNVVDLDRKQVLILNTKSKESQLLEMNADAARAIANPIDQLVRVNSKDAQPIGEETLDGRRTLAFRIRKIDLMGMKGRGDMLVWVDAETKLPSKIEIHDPDPKSEIEVRFEKFVWNQPLEASLFSLSVPKGFTSGTIAVVPKFVEPPKTNESDPVIADGVIRNRVPQRIIWSPTGSTITALMRDPESAPSQQRQSNELRQWDVTTGKLKWSQTVAGASHVAATKDGKWLATVIGQEVQLRDTSTGQVTRTWATREPLGPLSFSPDGKILAAGITEWGSHGGRGGKLAGGVELWDVEHAGLLRSTTDDKPVTFLKCSADGKQVMTSSNGGPVKLWDTTTGELTRILPGRMGADISPDGEFVACVSATAASDKATGMIDLFRFKDGSKVRSFTSERGSSASYLLWVTFSPNGRLLAATDWNGTVSVWNVESGKLQQSTKDSAAGAHTAVFDPDGVTLALGREDKTLHLWKLTAE